MGYLIGEYGFITNLIRGENAGIASDLIDEISIFYNKGRDKKIDVRQYVDETIAEQTRIEGTIQYLKRMIPTGGNILEWISDPKAKNCNGGFGIPSMGVDSEGELIANPTSYREKII